MFEPSTLVAYVAVVLGLFLIPGPAVLLVFLRTAQGGAEWVEILSSETLDLAVCRKAGRSVLHSGSSRIGQRV